LVVADLGVAWDDEPPTTGLIRRPIGRGTASIAQGPAMTRDQAGRALDVGIEIAYGIISDGAEILALGEMGIGNTTASAALVAAATARSPETVTGIGTGVDRSRWEHKVGVVTRALDVNHDRLGDPLGILAALGGFEIAGLAGAMIGAASRGVPVVLDGLIVTAAALIAVRLCPPVHACLLASHRSAEPGHRIALEFLELEPMMDLALRLGEGTGAALALHLARAACRIPREMATFGEAGVARDTDHDAGSARSIAAPIVANRGPGR
jgi:nicotinate-nucleotide--dimethylbenzimidazole phosphoribosyltransferase